MICTYNKIMKKLNLLVVHFSIILSIFIKINVKKIVEDGKNEVKKVKNMIHQETENRMLK